MTPDLYESVQSAFGYQHPDESLWEHAEALYYDGSYMPPPDEGADEPFVTASVAYQNRILSEIENNTPEQKRAIIADFNRPLVIIAGPGSGKTRVLTQRIAYAMINPAITPANILAITFTNKAAAEMKNRLETLIGPPAKLMDICTFHGLASRILRQIDGESGIPPEFSIMDEKESEALIRECAGHFMSVKEVKDTFHETKPSEYMDAFAQLDLLEILPSAKIERTIKTSTLHMFTFIRKKWKEEKKARKVLSYNDLEIELLRALQNPKIRFLLQSRYLRVFVDEYQDTNDAEAEIIRAIASHSQALTCVGDPDQSIYRWRGANVENILNFSKIWPYTQTYSLEKNFRSTPQITQPASDLIAHNTNRHHKTIIPTRPDGANVELILFDSSNHEARWITAEIKRKINEGVPPKEIAVICRSAAPIYGIQAAMQREKIMFAMHAGQNIADKNETRWLVSWIRAVVNPFDETAFLYALGTRPRGAGKKTVSEAKITAQETGQTTEQILKAIAQNTEGKKSKQFEPLITMFHALEEIRSLSMSGAPPDLIFDTILEKSELLDQLEEEKEAALAISDKKDREAKLKTISNREETIAVLRESAQNAENIMDLATNIALTNEKNSVADEAVWLGTIHASKALEFDSVFMPAFEENIIPSARVESSDPLGMQEERNLAFVGITRAKNHLAITRTKKRSLFGKTQENGPSPFLRETGLAHTEFDTTTPPLLD